MIGSADPRQLRALHAPLIGIQAWIAAESFTALQTSSTVAQQQPRHYLWPISWMQCFSWSASVRALAVAFVITAVAGVAMYRYRSARVLAAIMLLQWVAVLNAFTKLAHGNHHLVLAALILSAIPTLPSLGNEDGSDCSAPRATTSLRIVLTAQAVILFTYSLSGFWKIKEGLFALVAGRPSMFTSLSLPGHVGRQIASTGAEPLLAQATFDLPRLASAAFVATAFLELLAILTITRPRLARLAAMGLIAMHGGIYLTMGINFKGSIVTLVCLFLLSPFLADDHPTTIRNGHRASRSTSA